MADLSAAQQRFVDTYGPLADDVAEATGLDRSVVLGQIATETGWGQHISGNNIFGISPGGRVSSYASVPDAAADYVRLIRKRYNQAQVAAPQNQASALVGGGYNTVNPQYANTVNSTAATARNAQTGEMSPDFAKRWGLDPSEEAPAQAPAAAPVDNGSFSKRWGLDEAPTQTPAPAPQAAPVATLAPPQSEVQPDTVMPNKAFVGSPAYQTYKQLSADVARDPNMKYGELVPAKVDQAGGWHWAWPGAVHDAAQGVLDAVMAPKVGAMTPLATNALSLVSPSLNPSVAAGTYSLVNGTATRLAPGPGGKNTLVAVGQDAANPLAAPVSAPATSAEAKQVASQFYRQADQSGGVLTPQFTNKFIDSVTAKLPQTEAGKIVGGESSTSNLVNRLGALRDKPMSLQEAQEVDEALGDLVSKEYSVKGLSSDGKKIADIQNAFRNQIADAEQGDIEGGAGGFDALSKARKAWSQAMKMRDIERIQERANMTDNPQTSVKTQLRTILTNPARIRGYSPEEVDALKAATQRGVMGNLLHVFGSRLIPIAAGAAEAGTGGLTAGLMSAAGAHVATTMLRNQASNMAAKRLANAMQILGRNVPQNPLSAP